VWHLIKFCYVKTSCFYHLVSLLRPTCFDVFHVVIIVLRVMEHGTKTTIQLGHWRWHKILRNAYITTKIVSAEGNCTYLTINCQKTWGLTYLCENFKKLPCRYEWARGSSVDTGRTVSGSNPAGGEIFRTRLEPPIQWVPADFRGPGGKQPRQSVYHPAPT
jgi:hypothetical protein